MAILAGDVGGTKVDLALFDQKKCLKEARFKTRDYKNLEELLHQFIPKDLNIKKAVFAAAGPVQEGKVVLTNTPWEIIDEKKLEREFSIPKVVLLNDLEAAAIGCLHLSLDQMVSLNPDGVKRKANCAAIAAGTGLGMAGLIWHEERYIPLATEGSHSNFSPRNQRECRLLLTLQQKMGDYVPVDSLVSGRGLSFLYQFLMHEANESIERGADEPWEITRRALDRSCPYSVEAVNWFLSIYGSETGNLALRLLARGGVFVAGGIAAKIVLLMQSGIFLSAFLDKGPFRPLLSQIPLYVIKEEKVALIGAWQHALKTHI